MEWNKATKTDLMNRENYGLGGDTLTAVAFIYNIGSCKSQLNHGNV